MFSGVNVIQYNFYKLGDLMVWIISNIQVGIGSGVVQNVLYWVIVNLVQGNVFVGIYSDIVWVIFIY